MITYATLQRQDDGQILILDGVIAYGNTAPLLVPTHPLQGLGQTVDTVERLADVITLDVVVSETPAIAGLPIGPERVESVLAWLDAAIGVPLTLTMPRLPVRRDLLLSGAPVTQRPLLAVQIRISLTQQRVATVATVEASTLRSGGNGRGRGRSKDVTADRGEQPTRRISMTAAAIDSTAAFFGLKE